MEKRPDIKRLIEFQKLMYKFRSTMRFIHFPENNDDYENDVEHSYFLAMSGWFLAQYFPHLNRDKIIRFALIHDMVEIHAGDTFSYAGKEAKIDKQKREQLALKKLQEDWPDFHEMIHDIEEYEERGTEEAKFVYALDKIMPAIMNYVGKGHIWQKHGVTIDMFREEKESKISVSDEVYPYYKELIAILEQKPDYFAQDQKGAA